MEYHEQISEILNVLTTQEGHLLDENDQYLIQLFNSLSPAQKNAYFKLLNRKQGYIRLSTLKWPDSKTIIPSFGCEFIDMRQPDSLVDFLEELKKKELTDICKSRKIPIKNCMKVAELRALLTIKIPQQQVLNFSSNNLKINTPTTLFIEKVSRMIGPLFRLNSTTRDCFERFFIIVNRDLTWPDNSLLNGILTNVPKKPKLILKDPDDDGEIEVEVQDSSENNLTVRHFFPYKLNRIQLTFPVRETSIEYVQYLKIERDMWTLISEKTEESWSSANQLYNHCLPLWQSLIEKERTDKDRGGGGHVSGIAWMIMYTPVWVLTRIMNTSRKILHHDALIQHKLDKRNNEPWLKFANHLRQLLNQPFLHTKRGKWFEELIKIQSLYLKNATIAKDICLEALDVDNEPFVLTGCLRGIKKRYQKLLGNKKQESEDDEIPVVEIFAKKVFSQTGHKALYLDDETNEKYPVEELSLLHYNRLGWKGFHSENSTLTTLFALLFFDIIFIASVPGVFVSKYQQAPLDINTPYFYEAREPEIKKRLQAIQDGHYVSLISEVYDAEGENETMVMGLCWDFSKSDILEIAECITGPSLSKICERYAKLYWIHRGGVPDLCVWNFKEKKVKFVEVKGSGDVFSNQQREWMQFLYKDCGIDVEQFRVSLVDGKKRKRIA